MKMILDTANLRQLRDGAEYSISDRATSDPSLIIREGEPLEARVPPICEIIDGAVSAGIVATAADQMAEEARAAIATPRGHRIKALSNYPLTHKGLDQFLSGEYGAFPKTNPKS